MLFLKKLVNNVNLWFANRKLNALIASEELSQAYKHVPLVVREAHESYRLGDFVCTVVGSKEELEARVANTKANVTTKEAERYKGYNTIVVDKLRE